MKLRGKACVEDLAEVAESSRVTDGPIMTLWKWRRRWWKAGLAEKHYRKRKWFMFRKILLAVIALASLLSRDACAG